MAVVTTFLAGAVVGGGVKWAYDKWQAKEDRPTVASVREKSASTVRNLGQSVRNVGRRKKGAGDAKPEVVEASETVAEATAASA
ncbi:MAG: hypothetical protein R3C62_18345 [Chloroflexota bacterium]